MSGRWGGRASDRAGNRDSVIPDDWSPEAREAAAKARAAKSGGSAKKFHLSAKHPTNQGQKFETHANTHEETESHIGNMRKSFPEHHVTVHNKHSGMAHTFKPNEKYNRNYLD